jgi:hypothetical protein
MDHHGDTQHNFDANDAGELCEAKERFEDLMRLRYTAAVRSASGGAEVTRRFDPNAEETLFYPRLVGG